MKIKKIILLLTIIISTTFLLTACGDNTTQVSDKNGKSITVSTPDSDTYTFKLPVSQNAEIPIEEPQTENSESDPAITETESEESSEGPKTGEP